jgi:hypothetical protein
VTARIGSSSPENLKWINKELKRREYC